MVRLAILFVTAHQTSRISAELGRSVPTLHPRRTPSDASALTACSATMSDLETLPPELGTPDRPVTARLERITLTPPSPRPNGGSARVSQVQDKSRKVTPSLSSHATGSPNIRGRAEVLPGRARHAERPYLLHPVRRTVRDSGGCCDRHRLLRAPDLRRHHPRPGECRVPLIPEHRWRSRLF